MAKRDSPKDRKVKELILLLSSKEEKNQLRAIKLLKVYGNETVLEPLVKLLTVNKLDSVRNEIVDLLNSIKSTKAPAEIIKCLNNGTYKKSHPLLLASIWNSGLDYGPYLGEIATATVRGDFMCAVECITIIENMEEGFNEGGIMDALLVFKSYLVDNKSEDNYKSELIKEIVLILQQMNDSI